MKQIYLASSSPRRRLLLKQLIGDNFEIIKSNYEEDNTLDMKPTYLVQYHAVRKGRDVVNKLSSGIVIAADTIIVFNDKVFGKPKDVEEAKEVLRSFSGKQIEVITGYIVIDVETKEEIVGLETTKVQMADLKETFIEAYVNTGDPLDKAGSFGIHSRGAVVIKEINGCYFNVVGLPLYKLNQAFEKLGVSIFDYQI